MENELENRLERALAADHAAREATKRIIAESIEVCRRYQEGHALILERERSLVPELARLHRSSKRND